MDRVDKNTHVGQNKTAKDNNKSQKKKLPAMFNALALMPKLESIDKEKNKVLLLSF